MIGLCSKVCLAPFVLAVAQNSEAIPLSSLDADNDCGNAGNQGSQCALSALQLRASHDSELGNETDESNEFDESDKAESTTEPKSAPKLNTSAEPGDSHKLGSSPIWHYALDCFWDCHERAGFCSDFCGPGNACCRYGYGGPEECHHVGFWPILHAHTCVQTSLPETAAPPAVVTDPPTSEPPADGTDTPGSTTPPSPPADAAAPCVDESQYCGPWAADGECTKNAGYMGLKCKKSCGLCPGDAKLSTEPAATSAAEPDEASSSAPDATSAASATDDADSTAESGPSESSSSAKIGAGVNGTSCSAYPACVAVNIATGDCCPNAEGVSLGCCNGFPEVQNVVEVAAGTECSAFAGCVRLGLKTGACCPTASGARLGCCDDEAKPSAPALQDAQPDASEPISAEGQS